MASALWKWEVVELGSCEFVEIVASELRMQLKQYRTLYFAPLSIVTAETVSEGEITCNCSIRP